ncbi:hypothetical protein PSTG_07710 [Puccinia striiformis f. sp. tritici PST-78]|uniref:Uncharacterized protein n=1 Tax=Puccinia striiformis f. sp. tritici PST-78 TaxID=1165861 RepID=A0A0L0VJA4_9BASI|nr:hypothetical protein PSTG_07710 [Puccinia striiformis f. sp. tritici PST-78]
MTEVLFLRDGGTGHSHTDVLVLTRTPAGEDHDHHHQKPPSSSLLDRLGPPSLTSSDSNRADRRTQKQDDIPIPHSPKRTRRSSRSRSPPPPPAAAAAVPAPANRNTDQRRASLSSRITLSNRHQSCSPIAPTFDVKSRCLQIDRRFSSPSTSITTARRDSRIDSHFNTRIDKEKDRMNGIPSTKMLPSINLSVLQSHFMMPNRPRDFRIFDPYIAFNFERVLNLNSPFLPVQTRLVDPAQIQFLPSATTINNPPKQQQQQQAYLNLLR